MARTFERTLPVKLTVPELIERGYMLADQQVKAREIEAEKKTVADEYKASLETAGKEINRLTRIVHQKAEERPVKCRENRDYKRSVIEVVRLDTFEIVDSRVMTEAERQREIAEIDGSDVDVDEKDEPAAAAPPQAAQGQA